MLAAAGLMYTASLAGLVSAAFLVPNPTKSMNSAPLTQASFAALFFGTYLGAGAGCAGY